MGLFSKKDKEEKNLVEKKNKEKQPKKKKERKSIFRKKETTYKKQSVTSIEKDLNHKRYQNTRRNKKDAKKKKREILQPTTTPEVIRCFFQDFDEDTALFKISDTLYSACYEYQDVSFTNADAEEALNILCKWRDYLNTLREDVHVEVVNANTPVTTHDFKNRFRIESQESFTKTQNAIVDELNKMQNRIIGSKEITLITQRFMVWTVPATDFADAYSKINELESSAVQKFKEMDSSLRLCSIEERLELLYNQFNIKTFDQSGYTRLLDEYKQHKDSVGEEYSIYDLIAPKYINLRETDLIEIHESNELDSPQRFMRVLYVDGLPSTMTPRFYNKVTSLEDINSIVTLNIQPINNAKFIKTVKRQITSMKSERLEKVKRAHRNGYDYSIVTDENLEDRLEKANELRNDLLKNNQKIFDTNFLICVFGGTYEEITNATVKILEVANEQLIDVRVLRFQQLEGLINALPFGHNTLQFQRSLTSDATALNVPFNSKDIMQKKGLFFGQNCVSKKGVWVDRKELLNGNGCILATSGAGKSFITKFQIEQILLKYPEDEVIVIDPQSEYGPLIDAFKGQSIKISTTAETYINPFDISLEYGFDEDAGRNDPVKDKTEYLIAFVESLLGSRSTMSGAQMTIVDRCCKNVFAPYEMTGFKDHSLAPNLPLFYDELKKQSEPEAEQLALTLERFVHGAMNIFSHDTNINIKNRFVSFDISSLPSSMQTTGYLVVLDHIMNRLAHNKSQGKNTWIFIDEFHILLANTFSAEYIAKIYKVGRKFGALNTVITQNIPDVLNVEEGRKILSNSEFALILKQKPLDLPHIQDIFEISGEMVNNYITDPPAGQGILVYGKDKLPFYNRVSKDTVIYELNNTDSHSFWE